MRHAVVTRISLALCGLLLVASLVFAWRVAPPAATPDVVPAGSELFELHCAACHEVADLAAGIANGPDALDALLAFLQDHGTASAAEDSAIAAYLRSAKRERR